MKVNAKVKDLQIARDIIKKELKSLATRKNATIGIHEDAGEHEGGITNAQLGATLNYGAEIDHPGGTRYTRTAEGKARFISNESTAPAMGVTGPHKIIIPARPWLVPGVESGRNGQIEAFVETFVKTGGNSEAALEAAAVTAVGAVQQYMTDLKEPPNAKSTIKQKGSSNPLIDTGALRASVTYKINNVKPEEGL